MMNLDAQEQQQLERIRAHVLKHAPEAYFGHLEVDVPLRQAAEAIGSSLAAAVRMEIVTEAEVLAVDGWAALVLLCKHSGEWVLDLIPEGELDLYRAVIEQGMPDFDQLLEWA